MASEELETDVAAPVRLTSWSAAISQLPGFLAENPVAVPRPAAAAAREVTSAIDEDLAGDEEPAE